MARGRRTLRKMPAGADFKGDSFEAVDSTETSHVDGERCGILVRVPRALRDEMKILAIRHGTTVQNMMLKAIVDLVEASEMTSSRRSDWPRIRLGKTGRQDGPTITRKSS